jgi:hypothetical protein
VVYGAALERRFTGNGIEGSNPSPSATEFYRKFYRAIQRCFAILTIMKITKLGHACLDISQDGSRLIIDAGTDNFTKPLDDYSGISAVVVTHIHADHLDESKIHKIAAQNPSLVIYCTQQVADKLSEDWKVTIPDVGVQYSTGPFSLEFFGGQHAIILDDYPQDQNFGVLVNDTLYYPGDSLTPCPKPHTITATPSVAPWLKLSEAAGFIRQDSATQVFPTHNAIVNQLGGDMINNMLTGPAEQSGKKFIVLTPGESLEV